MTLDLPGSKLLGPVVAHAGHAHFFVPFIHDVFAMARAFDPGVYYFAFGGVAGANVLAIGHPVIACTVDAHTAIGAIRRRMTEVLIAVHVVTVVVGRQFQLSVPGYFGSRIIIGVAALSTLLPYFVYQL